MVSDQILQYFLDRKNGELEPRESMLLAALRGNRPAPKPKKIKYEHELCPDRQTFDTFLAKRIGFMGFQFHKATALLTHIPDWLAFLHIYNVIDETLQQRVLSALLPLAEQFRVAIAEYVEDPTMEKHICDAWGLP